jgi:hypothetical protein
MGRARRSESGPRWRTLMPGGINTIDSRFMLSILNEVLNGIQVGDFEKQLGVSEGYLRSFYRWMSSYEHQESRQIELIESNAAMMARAIALTIRALRGNEFQTRTGYDVSFAEEIGRQLGNARQGV